MPMWWWNLKFHFWFGLTGTGYFDMYAYQKYNDGEMSDYIPTDEEIAKSLAKLPVVD